LARIIIPKQLAPTTINVFLGLNESSDGSTELKLGEASKMLNWRITDGRKLRKTDGYSSLFPVLGPGIIQGQWSGPVNGVSVHLFAHHGNIYKRLSYTLRDVEKLTLTSLNNLTLNQLSGTSIIGTMADAKTSFIYFQNKVYMFNGVEYKSWDGTTFATVVGYRPKVVINAPPDGGIGVGLGASYELNNDLTGMKHETFSPDGVKTVYKIVEQGVDSIDFVKNVNSTKVLGTDYTQDLTLGTVTFTVAPVGGTPGTVDIGWTKGLGNRATVEKCLYAMDYSGQTDSRLFIWGDPANKARRRWTGLADGVPSAEYFESASFDDLGTGQYAITSIEKQYDRQKIFFEVGAMFSYYASTPLNGIDVVSFPSFELNEEIGNMAPNQAQIIQNKAMTIFNGVHEWAGTTVRDQTNEKLISQRVWDSLVDQDLTKAITCNFKEKGEYWLCIGSVVWIYNYRFDVWYKRDNVPASNFLEINGELYFGTEGTIMKFSKDLLSDNGVLINDVWEMGFHHFGAEWLTKYMVNEWISMKSEAKASVNVQMVTNNEGTSNPEIIDYNLACYDHVDYAHWSYLTSANPQPFYLEIPAMGFTYAKVVLKNTSVKTTATILSINLPARLGGKVR